MSIITLNKRDRYYLDGKFYIVKKGKAITRDILENGKVVTNENCLSSGEIIGNFFKLTNSTDIYIPEIEVEVEALEDNTILERLEFNPNQLKSHAFFSKIVDQLVKKSLIKFFYQLYDTQGYILAILKLYNNDNGFILKKDITYENFNISRSQFYLILAKLKKEKYVLEVNDSIYLNLKKIDLYLASLGEADIPQMKVN